MKWKQKHNTGTSIEPATKHPHQRTQPQWKKEARKAAKHIRTLNRTDIGPSRVYRDLKPDSIEIGFGCLKPDPNWKIGSVIGSVFTVLFFFFFANCSYPPYQSCASLTNGTLLPFKYEQNHKHLDVCYLNLWWTQQESNSCIARTPIPQWAYYSYASVYAMHVNAIYLHQISI